MIRGDLARALGVARAAAREAGELARRGYRRPIAVEHKGAVDLVTDYDRASEELLRDRLERALPYPVVGEEAGGATADEDTPVFFVDPIDGTTNFVHGHPFWCVSIGLVERGEPVLGVVVAPALGLEWSGWIAEDGAREARRTSLGQAGGDEPCRVSSVAALSGALLATGFPYDRRTSDDDNLDAFAALLKQAQGIRRCGSAALDLCLVADGTYDGYWEKKLNAWDVAGGAAVVRGAGGHVSDFEGRPEVAAVATALCAVATNGLVHDALLGALGAARVAHFRA